MLRWQFLTSLLVLVLTMVSSVSSWASPRFIIYYNSDASSISEVAQADYSHVIVSFLGARMAQGGKIELILPENMEQQWSSISDLKSKGIKVLISFGGGLAKAEDYKVLAGREGELADLIAEFVLTKGLDGVDLDFEASSMLHKKRAVGVADGKAFLIRLTTALREKLPSTDFLISHAPQSPYLNPEWHGGPYLDILKSVGDKIDWITVQYYNNPGQDGPIKSKVVGHQTNPYSTSFRGLVSEKGEFSWPADKIVVGKPVYKADAFSGHVTPQNMMSEIIAPLRTQYGVEFGGIAGWQFSTHTKDHQQWNSELGKVLLGE